MDQLITCLLLRSVWEEVGDSKARLFQYGEPLGKYIILYFATKVCMPYRPLSSCRITRDIVWCAIPTSCPYLNQSACRCQFLSGYFLVGQNIIMNSAKGRSLKTALVVESLQSIEPANLMTKDSLHRD